MKIISIVSKNYRSNTYLLISDGECFIIDPGMPAGDIIKAVNKSGSVPRGILLTHGHFDHIFSLDALREHYSVPVYVHENDAENITDSLKNAYSYFFPDPFIQRSADKTFKDGDILQIGSEYLTAHHIPGHTKGSSYFICGDIMITGDTLFADGIGRADLYGSDPSVLYQSLKRLREIQNSENITVYPGHGASASLSTALNNSIYYIKDVNYGL